jgi:hypothetical protein
MPNTYDHIASYTVTGSPIGGFVLGGLPQTYTDLEIITSLKCNPTYNNDSCSIQLNFDVGNNYYWTQVKGPTSGAIYSNKSGASGRPGAIIVNDMPSTKFSSDITYINGYSDTTLYKTITSKFAGDAVGYFSTMWKNTGAIHAITFLCDTTNDKFQVGSTVNVYGIKAA